MEHSKNTGSESKSTVILCPPIDRMEVDTRHSYFPFPRSCHSYTQEIPTRFKKEIVQAACVDTMGSGAVEAESFERVLDNIGVPPSDISHEEIEAIFKEMGNEQGQIPAQKMFQLL